ncbi:MAG TPA: hypothetical protein VHB21_14560 [Minicystis sp.]|nr:hypothetical protein [Minicystis sp.]
MLRDFLIEARDEIIENARVRAANRKVPTATPNELESGLPLFLDQLGAALERGATDGIAFEGAARARGAALLRDGFTVGQVVHGYGDVFRP